jgi:hypothetical protein
MPFSLADFVYGGLIPAALAAALWNLLPRRAGAPTLQRIATATAFVAAVHAGYWLLALGKPAPASHWEWLPWTLLLSLAGVVPGASGTRGRLLTTGLLLIVAVAASWVLVPRWEHLEPPRSVHLVALTAGIVLISVGLTPLAPRMPAARLFVLLAVVLVCESVILALAGSLRFAQIAGCGAAALSGMSLAAYFQRNGRTAEGIALPFAVLAAGMMLIGRVNSFSDVPLISYLLPPLAPLALWPLSAGPLAGTTAPRRWLLASLPVVLCLLAVGLAAMASA